MASICILSPKQEPQVNDSNTLTSDWINDMCCIVSCKTPSIEQEGIWGDKDSRRSGSTGEVSGRKSCGQCVCICVCVFVCVHNRKESIHSREAKLQKGKKWGRTKPDTLCDRSRRSLNISKPRCRPVRQEEFHYVGPDESEQHEWTAEIWSDSSFTLFLCVCVCV
jgi:hypothetical protein